MQRGLPLLLVALAFRSRRGYAIKAPQNSYWLLASSKTADTAQPAQRVSQAEPPLFFFLVSFCMLHGPMFSFRSIYVVFPRVLYFLRFCIS
jgi:hypothetical protein